MVNSRPIVVVIRDDELAVAAQTLIDAKFIVNDGQVIPIVLREPDYITSIKFHALLQVCHIFPALNFLGVADGDALIWSVTFVGEKLSIHFDCIA